jgi:hypothetical protein
MRLMDVPKVNTSVGIPNTNSTNLSNAGGLLLDRLPSSSRAYPLSFDKKVEAYRKMFMDFNIQ